MRKKRKTVWAFLDGKKLVDVVQAALDIKSFPPILFTGALVILNRWTS